MKKLDETTLKWEEERARSDRLEAELAGERERVALLMEQLEAEKNKAVERCERETEKEEEVTTAVGDTVM